MGVLDPITSKFAGSGSSFINTVGKFIIFLIVAGLILGVIWLIINRKRFNTLSPVFGERSGALKVIFDMGFYSKDKKNNLWDFKFKTLKETVMPPSDNIMGVSTAGKNVAYFYQNSGGEIYPCELKIITTETEKEEVTYPDKITVELKQDGVVMEINVIEPDIQLWNAQIQEDLFDKEGKQTWWDTYGNQILFYGTIVFILGILYLVFHRATAVEELIKIAQQYG